MIMFHGTNNTNGKQIILDKTIKCKVNRIYNNTTNNYAYLDQNVYRSLLYACNAAAITDESKQDLYIFKVNAGTLNVEEDLDEQKIDEKSKCIKYADTSFRVPVDIDLIKCCGEYLKIDYNQNKSLIHFLKSHTLELYHKKYDSSVKEIYEDKVRKFEENFIWNKI